MTTRELAELDKRVLWHPFTPMRVWTAPDHEPIVLTRGEGAWLWDRDGRRWLDGNSSIWTNIHGHSHPRLLTALREQAEQLAHSSFLGFTNEPAILLAAELLDCCAPSPLSRVFYTDDGSTAIECALKMTVQFWQQTGHPERRTFLAFDQAYHGDTIGAASLGGISLFHERFSRFGLPVKQVPAIEALETLTATEARQVAAVVIEPLIQGAAGMKVWPAGMLTRLRAWCDAHDVLLIFDEVMTGFGRTGTLFACQQEKVWPDFLCLAKGLSGGLLPLAATLTTERVYEAFLGAPEEGKTFYYGHSYCGNPLGCAVARASLQLFHEEKVLERLPPKIDALRTELAALQAEFPHAIREVRQCGFIAGIEVERGLTVQTTGAPLTAAGVCFAARDFGLLTRPVMSETIVLMLPLCVGTADISHAVQALRQAFRQLL